MPPAVLADPIPPAVGMAVAVSPIIDSKALDRFGGTSTEPRLLELEPTALPSTEPRASAAVVCEGVSKKLGLCSKG